MNENANNEGRSVIINILYMIHQALSVRKSIVLFCMIETILALIVHFVQLFIVPFILGGIENGKSLSDLIGLIIGMVTMLMLADSLKKYVATNTIFGRIDLRSKFTFDIHTKISKTSYPNLYDESFLKCLNRAEEAVCNNDGFVSTIWDHISDLIKNIIGLFIYMYILTELNIVVLAVIVITTIIGYFVSNYLYGWEYRNEEEKAEYIRKKDYINNIASDFSMAKDIRFFHMRDWILDVRDEVLKLYEIFIIKKENRKFVAHIMLIILMVLRNGFAYWYIISMTLNNNMSVAYFLLLFNAAGGVSEWIEGIFGALTKLHLQNKDINNFRIFLNYPELFLFEEGEDIEASRLINPQIRLNNVSFSYPDCDNNVVDNVSLTLFPGEKIAIVGENGAGKSTLIKLLMGFLEPDKGNVELNNENICKYNKEKYYQLFSAVFQNSSVLASSITCNVSQSFCESDMEKVISCIQRAGLAEKIARLPDQYNTLLGKDVYEEAIELSGGELQKLMIARALYKETPFLILDEPTASLDALAEKNIYEQYLKAAKERTTVFISHRLASTQFCDCIYLMEKGKIVEKGTHQELMEKRGKYYSIFSLQSKHYREGSECIG